ncbi:MAG: hypothetical protein HN991_04250 [Candidatus Jacksonbacteria bacterium]|nr:hypothetical protein [Candidatus Jacksonbacteria bacterium]
MAIVTLGTAIAKAVGVDIPIEIFIGEGGLIALFMRMGIIKLDTKLERPQHY